MYRPDPNSPQSQAARQFMEHKGLGHILPHSEDKLEGQPCFYFEYELPEGDLELEVLWDKGQWLTMVTTFTLVE